MKAVPWRINTAMDMRSLIDLVESASDDKTPLLFVVHPGSACGSADFNIGEEDAAADRAKLEAFLNAWTGGVIVLSGEHDAELRKRRYRSLGLAIEGALATAQGTGVSMTVAAPDPKQMAVSRKLANKLGLTIDHPIVVTGAWASRGDSGCVNSVVEALTAAGFGDVTLSDSAVFED